MQQRSTGSWIFRILSYLLFALMLMPVAEALRAQSDGDFDHGIIGYSKTAPTDPVARLQRRVDSGELTLEFDPRLGYLPAILRALNIPTSSQSLVFSKTSFQFTQIAPGRPRAEVVGRHAGLLGVIRPRRRPPRARGADLVPIWR